MMAKAEKDRKIKEGPHDKGGAKEQGKARAIGCNCISYFIRIQPAATTTNSSNSPAYQTHQITSSPTQALIGKVKGGAAAAAGAASARGAMLKRQTSSMQGAGAAAGAAAAAAKVHAPHASRPCPAPLAPWPLPPARPWPQAYA